MEEVKLVEVDVMPLIDAKLLNCCEFIEVLRDAAKVLEDYEID
ncbi:MAG: hypothetical protein QXK12_05265 [Candidatus Nezhaarchaeales archaeon]